MPAALPPSLELLPLYCMALAKNVAFRGGNDVRPDLRSYMMQLLSVMNVRTSTVFVYPRMFALHDMGPDVGKPMPSSNNNDAEVSEQLGRPGGGPLLLLLLTFSLCLSVCGCVASSCRLLTWWWRAATRCVWALP